MPDPSGHDAPIRLVTMAEIRKVSDLEQGFEQLFGSEISLPDESAKRAVGAENGTNKAQALIDPETRPDPAAQIPAIVAEKSRHEWCRTTDLYRVKANQTSPARVAQSVSLVPVAFRDGRGVQESQVRRPIVARFGTNEAQDVRPSLKGIERALTVADVAEYLSISRATVYRLVGRGTLPHFRVSNSIRFRERELQAFMRRSIVADQHRD
jgi:excisionase family DNA binding protein